MTTPILFKEDLGQRRHDLDWVRIGAFMLLILYHVGNVLRDLGLAREESGCLDHDRTADDAELAVAPVIVVPGLRRRHRISPWRGKVRAGSSDYARPACSSRSCLACS